MEHNEIKKYYSSEIEKNRLELDFFQLEGIRTKEIISRYLDSDKKRIIDIGGGAGYYSFWLKEIGYEISLIDISPKNIELAKEKSINANLKLDRIEIGDATNLKMDNEQFDIALLLGPLYHLTKKDLRIKALEEAKRVLRPGGVIICAIISRYASLFDGFNRDLVLDNEFEKIVINDLKSGVHENKTDNPEYFTTAYFHKPDELKSEIIASGLTFEKLVAIESLGWIVNDFKHKRENKIYMDKLLNMIRLIEEDVNILAMSPHILGIAKKPHTANNVYNS
jgi:ubiquinone/menaquinone biosynthesis C-methylase UbiE